jgi:polar amino acid transport system ATP-binding protein
VTVTTEALLSVLDLVKRQEGRTILDKVSLDVAAGEVVTVVGPSGGGKSTLLRCIDGLIEFDEGRVRVGDAVLGPGRNDRKTSLAVARRLGFVFQDKNLFLHRTALGNVMEAPVHVKGIAVDEARRRAIELLSRVGLEARKDAYPHELSGGEQQRVAIARALAMDPEVLLADEPTSALDPERRQEVLEVLRALARDGVTMVIVTHEMSFARDVSNRVVVLKAGKVDASGPPGEVLRD